jgi:hydrogenase nickel incorporation protein HypA/HybF
MHELSIVDAVLEIARRHLPAGARAKGVRLRAGPMRGIEPTAMHWAWRSATMGTEFEGAELELESLPWPMHCPACDRRFESEELFTPCACGYERPSPTGGDELQVVSLTVEDAESSS